MEWVSEIPGLSSVVEAFLETDTGALILDNREWLFDGLGVTVSLSILAGISWAIRVICGLGWSLCCLCGRGIKSGFEWRSERRSQRPQSDTQTEQAIRPNPDLPARDKKSPSRIINPTPTEISHITGMSPQFDPFPRSTTPASSGPLPSAARRGSRSAPRGYSAWPRHFGTLAKLLLLAALINAVWVSAAALQ